MGLIKYKFQFQIIFLYLSYSFKALFFSTGVFNTPMYKYLALSTLPGKENQKKKHRVHSGNSVLLFYAFIVCITKKLTQFFAWETLGYHTSPFYQQPQ